MRAFTSGLNPANSSSIVFFRSGFSGLGCARHSGKVATTLISWFFLFSFQHKPCCRNSPLERVTYRQGYVMNFLPPWSSHTVRCPSLSMNLRARGSLDISDDGMRSRNVVTPKGNGSVASPTTVLRTLDCDNVRICNTDGVCPPLTYMDAISTNHCITGDFRSILEGNRPCPRIKRCDSISEIHFYP